MTRVLIADDHPIILSGLEAILRDLPYSIVATAPDGEAALAALDDADVELLIVDVRMPGIDGIELLRLLRERGDERPVVLLTATLDDGRLVEAVRLGVNGIVLKEGAHSLLIGCLDIVRSGGRWIAPELVQRALDFALADGRGTDPLQPLSKKERAISELVAEGLRNRDIAARLGMNEGTVKVYLHRIYRKLGIGNRTELALRARG